MANGEVSRTLNRMQVDIGVPNTVHSALAYRVAQMSWFWSLSLVYSVRHSLGFDLYAWLHWRFPLDSPVFFF